LFSLGSFGSICWAQKLESGTGSRPLAVVNGESIYAPDLELVLVEMHSGTSEATTGAYDLDQALFRIVNDALLAQEARVLEMHLDEPIPSSLDTLRLKLAVDRLKQLEIKDPGEPTDEEIRRAFQNYYRTASLRMITTYERQDAEALMNSLEQGEDLEQAAREHSVDRYSPKGGLMADVDRIDMSDSIGEIVFGLRVGQVAGPIKTRLGWAIIRPESFGEADLDRLPQVESLVRRRIRNLKAEEMGDQLTRRLHTQHSVVIHDEVVEAILCERGTDGKAVAVVDDPEAVVAEVNAKSIVAESVGKELTARWRRVTNCEAALVAKPVVIDRMIRDLLLQAEALAREYDKAAAVERQIAARERQLLVPRYLNEVLAASIDITAEEIEAAYEENLDQFRKPPRVNIGQITVKNRDEAERLAELLRQGTDLAWLAEQHSVDKYRQMGGARGWVRPYDSVEVGLSPQLMTAAADEVIGPIGDTSGFLVVRVNAREEQGYYDLSQVRGRVREALRVRKFAQLLDQHISELRAHSEIVVHDDVLASLKITVSRDSPGAHGEGSTPTQEGQAPNQGDQQ